MNQNTTITDYLIAQGRSDAGGWTREQLKILGVPWPPKKGWRRKLVTSGKTITVQEQADFLRAREENKSKKLQGHDRVERRLDGKSNANYFEIRCAELGLDFRYSMFGRPGATIPNYHMMFGFDGRRVLEWWPATGRWYCPLDGEKGTCLEIEGVANLAAKKAALVAVEVG